MPKPFLNLTGNGCHAHVSLWNGAGKTYLYHDLKGELANWGRSSTRSLLETPFKMKAGQGTPVVPTK
jgi:glutamine synthetase